jgi:hypothetical protein
MAREARFVSTTNAPAPGVDVAACDREPIHIPGSIQPHGSLLVLSAESLTVLQVSENSATALGVEPAKLLGLHLADVLGADHAQQLGPAMQALPAGEPAVLLASLTPPRAARRCHAIAHRVDQVLVLELEEIRPAGPAADLVSIAAGFSSRAESAKSIADLGAVQKTLEPAVKQPDPTTTTPAPDEDENAQGASAGGQSELGRQLDLVASLIELGVPTRVYSVSLGGFDTHSDERGTQQRLLTELDRALSTFQARLATTDRGRQVVTTVYSEFGRRVTANASDGTDHGTAGPVFVLGRGVTGGFHGAEPSLTDLDDGDLKAGLDFRSVYASLLGSVLGAEPGQVLGGWEQRVDGLFT